MTKRDLIDMRLHEIVKVDDDIEILRVVGGCIYTIQCGQNTTSTFVPFKDGLLDSDLLNNK